MNNKKESVRMAKKDGRALLTEVESKQIIGEAGIEVVETRLVRTQKEAILIAKEMGSLLC